MINFEDFKKIELKVARVLSAERVENSEKLIKLQLEVGDKNEVGELVNRQIVAGIGKSYNPEDLIGKEIVIVANLEPRQLMGLESNGMLLAAHGENGEPIILIPEKPAGPGSKVS